LYGDCAPHWGQAGAETGAERLTQNVTDI
jgi:hypothetical protein